MVILKRMRIKRKPIEFVNDVIRDLANAWSVSDEKFDDGGCSLEVLLGIEGMALGRGERPERRGGGLGGRKGRFVDEVDDALLAVTRLGIEDVDGEADGKVAWRHLVYVTVLSEVVEVSHDEGECRK